MYTQPATDWVSPGGFGKFGWGLQLRRNSAGQIEFRDAARPDALVFAFAKEEVANFFEQIRTGAREGFLGPIGVRSCDGELWLFDERRGCLYLDFFRGSMMLFFRAVCDGMFDWLLEAPVPSLVSELVLA